MKYLGYIFKLKVNKNKLDHYLSSHQNLILKNVNSMNFDFSKMSDDELEQIIRKNENINVPGSRFQRAMTELDLRYKKRGHQPGLHLEAGGNITMDGGQFILGENNVMTVKTKKELTTKNSVFKQSIDLGNKYTMENPFIHFLVYLLLAITVASIAYFAVVYKLPLHF